MFVDESGFMLQPVVRRTWAPRGQTPILRQWDRHDRLSVISAITVSRHRRRLGLYWHIYSRNIRAPEVILFLRRLLGPGGRRRLLIWDRGKVHRAALMETFLRRHRRRVTVEWLPPYAPKLNPVEQVWNHSKYSDLPNLAPDDVGELRNRVRSSFRRTRGQLHLLRSFFQKAQLKL